MRSVISVAFLAAASVASAAQHGRTVPNVHAAAGAAGKAAGALGGKFHARTYPNVDAAYAAAGEAAGVASGELNARTVPDVDAVFAAAGAAEGVAAGELSARTIPDIDAAFAAAGAAAGAAGGEFSARTIPQVDAAVAAAGKAAGVAGAKLSARDYTDLLNNVPAVDESLLDVRTFNDIPSFPINGACPPAATVTVTVTVGVPVPTGKPTSVIPQPPKPTLAPAPNCDAKAEVLVWVKDLEAKLEVYIQALDGKKDPSGILVEIIAVLKAQIDIFASLKIDLSCLALVVEIFVAIWVKLVVALSLYGKLQLVAVAGLIVQIDVALKALVVVVVAHYPTFGTLAGHALTKIDLFVALGFKLFLGAVGVVSL